MEFIHALLCGLPFSVLLNANRMPTANMVDFIVFFKHYQRSNRKVGENTFRIFIYSQ